MDVLKIRGLCVKQLSKKSKAGPYSDVTGTGHLKHTHISKCPHPSRNEGAKMFRVMTQRCSEGKGREQLISDRDTSVKLTIKKPSVEN